MVCASVREDNPRALARGLSFVHMHKTMQLRSYCTSMHVHDVHCEIFDVTSIKGAIIVFREHSGSVVECVTRDRETAGSSLTGVTALWSLSKTHLS